MRRRILVLVAVFAATATAQVADDSGPAILSRGAGPTLGGGLDPIQLRPYLSLNGVYDTGLTPVSVDGTGRIPEHRDYGGEIEFGVIGYRRWRHTFLGIDYRGSVRKYAQHSYYDGTDHVLTLGVTRQLSRRTTLMLTQAAGTYSRSTGCSNGYYIFDPSFANAPADELFDSRTFYFSPMADLTFQKTARLSFNIGGTGTFVRRRSRALVGTTGGTARGDVAYRVNRRATIGADYSFTHYEFTNAFGASDFHTVAFNLSSRLGRSWELGLRAGAGRAEILGQTRIALDPILAAIIGQYTAIVGFHSVRYLPSAEGKLTRVFRGSVLAFGYNIGLSPGNGLYMTSRSQTASAGYSYTSRKRVNFGISAGYSTYSSLAQDLGKYESYNGGLGVTYKLTEWLHLSTGYNARRYDADNSRLRRLDHRATLGLALSPSAFPLPLW